MATSSWQDIAKQKRDAIDALIPQEWRIANPPSVKDQIDVTQYIQQFLDQEELEITSCGADELAQKIASGSWSAEKVTRAFCHRAALAHQLLHCLLEIFFDAAIADARKLDEYYKAHGKTKGPLHGVPLSLKDQFHVKDVDTSMGYVGWIGTFEGKKGTGKEKVYESEMVTLLRNAGAVFYVKTSVPHTLMMGETINNIVGESLNPKNRNLSPGGSSGGEGALIGARGSPLGLGTDIGGSIRLPAAFNGLYGLRPSVGRFPYEGMANSMDGQNSILSVVGPISTNATSLKLFGKALLEQKPWLVDPSVLDLPWRTEKEVEPRRDKLSFGVIKTDGVVNVHPPVLRAVGILTKALQDAGHEIIQWTGPSHDKIVNTGMKSWFFDGGTDVKAAFDLSGEPMVEPLKWFSKLEREFTGSEIAATNVELRKLKKEYLDYWNSTAQLTSTGRPIDAIITPVAPVAAPKLGKTKYYGYSVWVNAVDYTTVVVPVTHVDQSVDKRVEGYEALSELDGLVQDDYDPALYHGAHVSLQIVGRRLEEEKMVSIAEYIESLKLV